MGTAVGYRTIIVILSRQTSICIMLLSYNTYIYRYTNIRMLYNRRHQLTANAPLKRPSYFGPHARARRIDVNILTIIIIRRGKFGRNLI